MSAGASDDRSVARLETAVTLLSIDPAGLGGLVLTGAHHDVARACGIGLRHLLGEQAPLRRLPPGVTDDRLLGGLDLAASMATGRRVVMKGVLAECDGGLLVVPLAERLPSGVVSALGEVLDTGRVVVERDGITDAPQARLAVLALDEEASGADDVRVAPALADRLAFHLPLPAVPVELPAVGAVVAARGRLPLVAPGNAAERLVALAQALGVASLRAVLQAMRAARAHAAWRGDVVIGEDDLVVAAELVLAARATRLPDDVPDAEPTPPEAEPSEPPASAGEGQDIPQDLLLESVRALLPADILDSDRALRRKAAQAGRRGREQGGADRGRQVRATAGLPGRGKRLDAVATLRAAAPWQVVRRRQAAVATSRLHVARDDFRIRRFKRQAGTTTIIAVDASGSMALQRLAEAKGAVELLLARTYVRRDRVALVVFRGDRAAVLLPPTRALARAKRAILSLPGGGGTPLASAIEAVHGLAMAAQRDGQDVVSVFLTDGRANIARDGQPGREQAVADAVKAARLLRLLGGHHVVVDTSMRGEPRARELAQAMGARYLPLPDAAARDVARVVHNEQRAGTPT